MRSLLLVLLFVVGFGLVSKAQSDNNKYRVIAYTDSIGKIKGILQKATADGITVEDTKGNRVFLSPQVLYKVKIRKKTITAGQGFVVGGTAALASGAVVIFGDNTTNAFAMKAIATAGVGILGAMFGTIVGGIAESANTKLVLLIKNDPLKYKNNLKKLEKYVKTSYVDTPVKP